MNKCFLESTPGSIVTMGMRQNININLRPANERLISIIGYTAIRYTLCLTAFTATGSMLSPPTNSRTASSAHAGR